MARLAVATHNAHKAVEIAAILAEAVPGFTSDDVATAADFGSPAPVEDGVTFEQNALIKARALAVASGLPAIADDSGLAVDVMGGAPGIFSALWAGVHGDDAANLDLLLAQMRDIPGHHRRAVFVCAAALVTPTGEEVVQVGRLTGTLTREPRGERGFGYDPIFVADGQAVSNAELDPLVKNAISHRGQAFRALAPFVQRVLGALDTM